LRLPARQAKGVALRPNAAVWAVVNPDFTAVIALGARIGGLTGE